MQTKYNKKNNKKYHIYIYIYIYTRWTLTKRIEKK